MLVGERGGHTKVGDQIDLGREGVLNVGGQNSDLMGERVSNSDC